MNRLNGQVVAITGGLGDIGRATAARLLAEGARVALIDVAAARKHPWLAAHRQSEVFFCEADVSVRTQVDHAFATVVARFGQIDVLIANAGMVANQPFLEIDAQSWDDTLRVNLTGAFHCALAAARLMVLQAPRRSRLRGKILFTSSWVQQMPWPEGAAYATSKAGLQMLAKVMAQELASQGITVNVLAPGIVMAGLSARIHAVDASFRALVAQAIPLGEMQTAESVAGSFYFLCSEDSDYMTGATLLIDGGASLVRRDPPDSTRPPVQ